MYRYLESHAMTAHTPGPWRYSKQRAFIWAHQGREVIASVAREVVPDDMTGATIDANAVLIAAAPDLLAACQAFMAWYIQLDKEPWAGTSQGIENAETFWALPQTSFDISIFQHAIAQAIGQQAAP